MIIMSVIFHTFVYSSVLNLASFIFSGKLLSTEVNVRLITILFMIMCIGYIGRIRDVKDIYHAYGENIEKGEKSYRPIFHIMGIYRIVRFQKHSFFYRIINEYSFFFPKHIPFFI